LRLGRASMRWRRPGFLFGVGAWLLVIALAVWANVLPFALYAVVAAVLLALIRIGRGGTRQPWLKWSLLLLLGVVLYVFVAYLYALHHQR
jgi:hypothetical protein